VIAVPTPGPRRADRAANIADPAFIADIFIDEARRTGDQGFYTLAESAADCALKRDPTDGEAHRTRIHLLQQAHRFADVATEARGLIAAGGDWRDHAMLGDALMEQGKLDEAATAYQEAVDAAPNFELYDRIAWLRWLWGDVDGAVELESQAVAAAPVTASESRAWVLVALGWFHALGNQPAPELDEALSLVPDYPPALASRARLRLFQGDRVGAAADLAKAAPTFENARARWEIDPSVNLDAVCSTDPRGCARWLTDRDPARALTLATEELNNRQDATTHMIHAYALFRAGPANAATATDEANAALATGIVEPRVLLQGGIILRHRHLLERALSMGPGLLPSERALAEATLATLPPT
jgi:tetratricopeptide (TPR) repeat protein